MMVTSQSSDASNAASWLKHELESRKSKNPNYSLRAFARKLEISPGNLSQILNGKKLVSGKIGRRIVENLELSTEEKKNFLSLVASSKHSTTFPIHTATPDMPAINFVGRESLIGNIEEKLEELSNWISFCLYGARGSGKSALALQLIESSIVRNKYPDGLIWLSAGSNHNQLSQLRVLCEALKLELNYNKFHQDECIIALKNFLADKRILIVIDDIQHIDDIESYSIAGKHCGVVYITDTERVAKGLPSKYPVNVESLDRQDALTIITDFLPELPQKYLTSIAGLTDLVGNLPLPLIYIGQYLRKAFWKKQKRRLEKAIYDVRDALINFKSIGHHKALENQQPELYAIVEPVKSLFDLKINNLSPKATNLLKKLTHFLPAPNTFAESVLVEGLGIEVTVLDELVDEGLIEIDSSCRYAIHKYLYSWIESVELDADEIVKLCKYYQKALETHSLEFIKESDNLVISFNLLASFCEVELLRELALLICQSARDCCQFDIAIDTANHAIEVLCASGHKEESLILMIELSKAYYYLEKYELALNISLDMLKNLDVKEQSEDLFNCYIQLASLGIRLGDKKLTEKYIKKLDEFEEKDRFKDEELTYLYLKSEYLAKNGYFAKALITFRYVLRVSKERDYQKFTSFILAGMGRIYLKRREGIKALEVFSEYLNLITRRNLDVLKPLAFLQLAAAEKLLGNYARAKNWFDKADQIMIENNHQKFRPLYYLDFADFNLEKGDFELAKEALDEYVKSPQSKLKYYDAAYNFLRGEYSFRKGDYEQAFVYFTKASELAVHSGFLNLSLRFRIQQAKSAIKLEKLSTARKILDELVPLIREEDHVSEYLELQVANALYAAYGSNDKELVAQIELKVTAISKDRNCEGILSEFTEVKKLLN